MAYQPDGNPICVAQKDDSETLAIAGIIKKTKLFNIDYAEKLKEMFIRAVNNRTRERNYFKLYCDLLDGNITEEDFDTEIDKNEDKYVTSQNKEATIEDIELALAVSPKLMDVKDPNDMAELFSFSEESMLNSIQ